MRECVVSFSHSAKCLRLVKVQSRLFSFVIMSYLSCLLIIGLFTGVSGYEWGCSPFSRSTCTRLRGSASSMRISEKASRILDSCNGDVNVATQMIFQEDEATTDARARMWNAVAEYLPLSESEGASPRAAKKLQTIAEVVVQTKDKKKQGRVLDVGAGSGLLVPMLKKAGLQIAKNYVALDLSNVMIDQLCQKYSSVSAHVGDFLEWQPEEEGQFETVLLNGVLQYNPDPLELVYKAAKLSSRTIVLSHYRGLSFIDEERGKMPGKIWDMPSRETLRALNEDGWELDEKCSRADHECKDFYLLTLRKVGS